MIFLQKYFDYYSNGLDFFSQQVELLDEMLDCGKLEAIIVKVATLGLDQSHLGKTLVQIRPHLHKMVIFNSHQISHNISQAKFNHVLVFTGLYRGEGVSPGAMGR